MTASILNTLRFRNHQDAPVRESAASFPSPQRELPAFLREVQSCQTGLVLSMHTQLMFARPLLDGSLCQAMGYIPMNLLSIDHPASAITTAVPPLSSPTNRASNDKIPNRPDRPWETVSAPAEPTNMSSYVTQSESKSTECDDAQSATLVHRTIHCSTMDRDDRADDRISDQSPNTRRPRRPPVLRALLRQPNRRKQNLQRLPHQGDCRTPRSIHPHHRT